MVVLDAAVGIFDFVVFGWTCPRPETLLSTRKHPHCQVELSIGARPENGPLSQRATLVQPVAMGPGDARILSA